MRSRKLISAHTGLHHNNCYAQPL